MSDLLTTAEVAARLGVAPFRVRRWIRDGHLVAHKHGRDYLVAAADLGQFRTPPRGRRRARTPLATHTQESRS